MANVQLGLRLVPQTWCFIYPRENNIKRGRFCLNALFSNYFSSFTIYSSNLKTNVSITCMFKSFHQLLLYKYICTKVGNVLYDLFETKTFSIQGHPTTVFSQML